MMTRSPGWQRPDRFLVLLTFATAGSFATSPPLTAQDGGFPVAVSPLQRGLDAYKAGDFDSAIADESAAIQLNPNDEKAYYNRALAYTKKGNYDPALTDLNQAVLLDPKDEKALNNRGVIFQRKSAYDQALADFNQSLQLVPNDTKALNNRGTTYKLKGDYDKALTDYNAAIQIDAQDPEAYYNRAEVYGGKGDYDKAIADLDQVVQLAPKIVSTYILRAEFAKAKSDYRKAIADLNLALQVDPQNVAANSDLALVLATCPQTNLRDGKKAVEYATKACESSQWQNPPTLDALAAACAEAGDFANAVKWETQYLQTPNLNPDRVAGAKSRLALYHANQPYHAGK